MTTSQTTPHIHYDTEEIRKFEAMAAEWWDKHGKFKPLHQINPQRLDYIDAKIGLAGKQVLDVGCGGGLLAEHMALRGASVTGIDRSPKALGVAQAHAKQSGVEVNYVENDAETWSQQYAQAYDAVTCLEVLEHVPDVPRTVKACADMIRPGGMFFFATLNRTPASYIKAIIGAEYVMRWLPKGTHEYGKFIRPSEMYSALRAAGFEVKEIKGMSYSMATGQFSLSDDLSVNYLGCAVKPA
ncbi:MAG: bifunctional 3-demethylubiquinol 3-O-methyltransferase/2-polyprenyl-6-hydroxyphenol methylase [Zetaproteobacteria bacterium CG_4_9_14_3_um_filter_49_83]|nr:MAG: bifunctional 3-demethylubiquinol 3-O-methyltransferase/2-polyprenyl-6-hydroxyphenol methylase [Zetaproteobacteria bacterium CG1_02_49_23]PIQ34416.1 MAG: bifunctional 3-demethylubiquinol 3-O-methyltransferase/2-polyprenyl-6-hydroxyphenol methylase [Zetaproteobacteria bacterium CG17_big_fil_post_rev_8_21_14_2_50_50_13]PIV30947.1 MAG: bifunctional 3-demethylubiquinol 3-O-methyltransferase/2-polyprenyl-6-hydroxyphenol methylase [Zetaproteobacteria bacterium CG02_land_8_20_14_3_00_50_9]PIY564